MTISTEALAADAVGVHELARPHCAGAQYFAGERAERQIVPHVVARCDGCDWTIDAGELPSASPSA